MKAIFFEEHGEIEVLKFADIPDPKPRPGQALVRVRAIALNHLDIWVRRGWKGLHLEMPHVGGSDIAGEIVSVNGDSSDWRPGTKVIVYPGISTTEDEWTRQGQECVSPGYKIIGEQTQGGMAEYVCVPTKNLYTMPAQFSFEEAAAPLLVATTCWRMLFKQGALSPGQSVLVVGAGGGVNSLSIQLSKAVGAKVIALTSSSEKAERARALGASEIIDYKKIANWPMEVLRITRGRGVDLVIDNVGHETLAKSIRAVARGGRIVTVGNTTGPEITFDNRLFFTKQISLIGSTMGTKQDFIDALEFMWANNIKPVLDRVEPLKDGIKALKRLEDGHHFGKMVLAL